MWRYETVNYASSDYEFGHTVTASSGKKIKAGGYWMGGSTHAQPSVFVNGPTLDSNGDGTGWNVQGFYGSPLGSYSLTIYIFEE